LLELSSESAPSLASENVLPFRACPNAVVASFGTRASAGLELICVCCHCVNVNPGLEFIWFCVQGLRCGAAAGLELEFSSAAKLMEGLPRPELGKEA
jgi:hypothetical protein